PSAMVYWLLSKRFGVPALSLILNRLAALSHQHLIVVPGTAKKVRSEGVLYQRNRNVTPVAKDHRCRRAVSDLPAGTISLPSPAIVTSVVAAISSTLSGAALRHTSSTSRLTVTTAAGAAAIPVNGAVIT